MNINLESAKDTLCKNILIYGYCKFENKGCAFNHPSKAELLGKSGSANTTTNPSAHVNANTSANVNANIPANGNINAANPSINSFSAPNSAGDMTPSGRFEQKKKFNFNTPSFQPSASSPGPASSAGVSGLTNKFSNLSPKLDEIRSFVPAGSSSAPANYQESGDQSLSNGQGYNTNGGNGSTSAGSGPKKFNVSANIFTPSSFESSTPPMSTPPITTPSISNQQLPNTPMGPGPSPMTNPYANTPPIAPQSAGSQSIGSASMNVGSADLYYQSGPTNNYPLNYHLYAPAPPPRLAIPLAPHETNANDMFIDNNLRETLQKKNEATLMTMGRGNFPDSVNVYHSLTPIDMETKSKVWKIKSIVFKVFSNVDGNPYILRKLDQHELVDIDNESPFRTIKRWKLINNSNIVKLQDCFTTIAFGGNNSQLCIVYDYYPNANTLLEQHINRKLGGRLEPVTESLLWAYIIQITNALLTIHENGLAARSSLSISKIIVTSKNRIKLGSCGISDILNYDNDKDLLLSKMIKQLQKEDLKNFGYVILELANLMLPITMKHNQEINPGDENVAREVLKKLQGVISQELTDALSKLIFDYMDVNLEKFNQIYLSKKLMIMINNLQDSQDYTENQLTSELENARLFRLMTKLNFILDNPNLNWKENERIYVIKLFNDYVFHQTDEVNKPIIDLSRVLIKLNKLDCGIDEKFMLITRDEKLSILISYKELRDLIDSVFRTLTK